ncbi:type II toxin-antitoxin system RnlB family antitoxin [Gracilibacillus phocaeensis]|uniref:type II toxin-antitoxin system RnlB family antitoxin n=1 Tax=Gracilibacillus phocaeensis TaxID=2042304 RepID=UPI00102F44D4|nr:type II toxin-antitoxin system RnlB family antitoxin [Gracilibacillus phocaeensis]
MIENDLLNGVETHTLDQPLKKLEVLIMKCYDIVNFPSDNQLVVVSTSYISPLSKLFLIANELKSSQYKGELVFDLLLSNGFASNRFLKMEFDGQQVITQSVEVLPDVSENLLKDIYKHFYEHPEYLENCILPDAQKYLIRNNLINDNLIIS